MGDVMSDLQGRRAIIMGMDAEAGYQKLSAKIPLKELSNYSVALSSLTGGRASFTTKFASYELVPNDIQQALIAEHEAEMAEEEASQLPAIVLARASWRKCGVSFFFLVEVNYMQPIRLISVNCSELSIIN
jgi:hypothetical protein